MNFVRTPRARIVVALGLLIVLAIISHWHWFHWSSVVSHGDWGFLFAEQYQDLFDVPRAWSTSGLGQSNIVNLSRYPLALARAALIQIVPEHIVEKIVVLHPFLFASTVLAFLVFYRLTRSAAGAFVGSLVLTYNTYVLTTGNMLFITAHAIGLSALWLHTEALKRNSISYSLLAGGVLTITSVYEFRAFYVMAWVIAAYSLYHGIRRFGSMPLKQYVIVSAAPLVLAGLLNAYWLLSTISIDSLSSNRLFSRPLFGDQFFNLANAITLWQPFWTGGRFAPFTTHPVPVVSWFIPLLAGAGLWLNRKNATVVFFGAVALVGIFLAKQSGEPGPDVYQWLYNHLPGFGAFREASKFYYLIALGYAVLLAALVGALEKRTSVRSGLHIRHLIVVGIVLVLFLPNTKPLISQEIGRLFSPRSVPQDYRILKDFLRHQGEFGRTLWVPTDSRWSYASTAIPKLSLATASQTVWFPFFQDSPHASRADKFAHFLQSDIADSVLDNASIRYIIVPVRDTANEDNFFVHYGERDNPDIRQWYISLLDQLPYLTKLDIGTTELVVYENTSRQPYFSAVPTMVSLTSVHHLNEKYAFITAELGAEFAYVHLPNDQPDAGHLALPTIQVESVFETLTPNHITDDAVQATLPPAGEYDRVYAKRPSQGPGALHGSYTTQQLSATETTLFSHQLTPEHSKNIVPNPSVENGLWRSDLTRCLSHDSTGLLDARVDTTRASEGNASLQITASDSSACAEIGPVPIHADSLYLLSFDYRTAEAAAAAYRMQFDTGPAQAAQLAATNSQWRSWQVLLTVPSTAASGTLLVYAEPAGETPTTVHYDNFRLTRIPHLHHTAYLVGTPGATIASVPDISFTLDSPTMKQLTVSGADEPFFLRMNERYHPQWRLRTAADHKSGYFTWAPWFQSDHATALHHFPLNSFNNGWYVDTNELCAAENACSANDDGTYDITLTVEYVPQRWIYTGSLISIATLLGLGVYAVRQVRATSRRPNR